MYIHIIVNCFLYIYLKTIVMMLKKIGKLFIKENKITLYGCGVEKMA